MDTGSWYHGDTWDGVVFQPHKNIQWVGFGIFISNHDETTFKLKYKHKINDGGESEEKIIDVDCSLAKENVVDFIFEEPIAVAAEEKLHITTSHQIEGGNNTSFRGQNGSEFETVENQHMGLFTIMDSDTDRNSSGIWGGQTPSIFFHLD